MDKTTTLYVVVPCYREEEVLPTTRKVLCDLLDSLVENNDIGQDSRVLFVDDGSTDNTWAMLEAYAHQYERVAAVKLAGNVGHQNALLAGLTVAAEHADAIVSIDADLQDDEQAIKQMLEHYHQGCDIVYGVRDSRATDTWFKRTTAQGFYKIMNYFGVKTIYNHADYRLMSQRAVKQLLCYGERNVFLRGIVTLVGYKTAKVYYDRKERMAGESKYPLSKMLSFAADGITSFSIKPVRFVLLLGLFFILTALCILGYVIWSIFRGNIASGWASIMLSVWFVGGCILTALGVVGEYIGKIYIEVKKRPRFNIEKIEF